MLILDWLSEGMGLVVLNDDDPASAVQAILIRIRDRKGPTTYHVVTSAHFPKKSVQWCESVTPKLRGLFPNASICFNRTNEEGFAEVYVPEGDPLPPSTRLIAAAVAAVKRIGGWDESDAIRVRITPSGEEISLSPRLVHSKWIVP